LTFPTSENGRSVGFSVPNSGQVVAAALSTHTPLTATGHPSLTASADRPMRLRVACAREKPVHCIAPEGAFLMAKERVSTALSSFRLLL